MTAWLWRLPTGQDSCTPPCVHCGWAVDSLVVFQSIPRATHRTTSRLVRLLFAAVVPLDLLWHPSLPCPYAPPLMMWLLGYHPSRWQTVRVGQARQTPHDEEDERQNPWMVFRHMPPPGVVFVVVDDDDEGETVVVVRRTCIWTIQDCSYETNIRSIHCVPIVRRVHLAIDCNPSCTVVVRLVVSRTRWLSFSQLVIRFCDGLSIVQ